MYLLFLESVNSTIVQPDTVNAKSTIDGHTNLGSGNSYSNEKKQQNFKSTGGNSGGVITAADMYEPGFRIQNAGLCSPRTRLLVLITSAALPAHSQNRQAIRMTWMNRYGPVVSMAFLVGTPQISETDPIAQVLETEEEALKIHMGGNNIDISDDLPENSKPSINMVDETLVVNEDPGLFQHLKYQKLNPGEGLDEHAMSGLNKAERAVQRVLGREHSRYGDMVQCQSRDTYTNLTLKSIAALEWTREYCPWAQYLLKTDDDMFIDVHRLLKFINKIENEANSSPKFIKPLDMKANVFKDPTPSDFDVELPPTIWGRLAHRWRPIRQHMSKYFVSRTQYSGQMFPDFCTGPAYLMTRSTIHPLYEAALGKDFDVSDDEDEVNEIDNIKFKKNTNLGTGYGDSNQTSVAMKLQKSKKNTVPYLKLEDVYLTGVVAERLTRRAIVREAQRKKEKFSLRKGNHDKNITGTNKFRPKTSDIIVKIRRIHNDQFANKKITGRALDRAICNGANSGNIIGSGGFSWFRWYWGDTSVGKDKKQKKKDLGVISVHMVKHFEQFDLWRRLMDGRAKCKT